MLDIGGERLVFAQIALAGPGRGGRQVVALEALLGDHGVKIDHQQAAEIDLQFSDGNPGAARDA